MNIYRTGPETERLEHRAMIASDAEAFFALNSHPEVMRYTGEPPLASIDEARDAIVRYQDFESVGYGRWACILKETGEMIGFSGLKYLPELDCVDVGFRFLPQYWGKGLGTEACAASLTFGFDVLELEEIIGLVLEDNAASIRVLEKCAMHPDGSIEYDGDHALRYVARRQNA